MEVVLDYEKDIRLDLNKPRLMHAHFIESHKLGLHHLAEAVRTQEQHHIDANVWPSGGSEHIEDFQYWEPITYCQINWFSITLTNYLRLVALVDIVERNQWSLHDLVQNEKQVNAACRDYVTGIVPAVVKWRNKVAAHPAATAPVGFGDGRGADKLGTLLQSFSAPVSRTAGYFEVGRLQWAIDGQAADVDPWSVTATYERLTARFWPDASLKPHRHRPGSEPADLPGTYLRLARTAI